MKYNIIIAFCILVLAGCDKYKTAPNDGKGSGLIRGRLFLYDTLTRHAIGVPQSGKTIRLFYQESTDALNYLVHTTTDKDGYFLFNNLDKGRAYRVEYEERADSARIYVARREQVVPTIDSLTLNATLDLTRENGLFFTIVDENNAPVKGASVCLYNNSAFFQPGKCDNSRYALTTDDYGHAFKFNIPAGTYQTTAYITINGSQYLANDVTTLNDAKVFRKLVLVKARPTEFNFNVRDAQGNALAGATLCFYSSEILFNTGDCAASNLQKVSGIDGKVKVTELPPGRYFVRGRLEVGSLVLTGTGEITIVSETTQTQDFLLQ